MAADSDPLVSTKQNAFSGIAVRTRAAAKARADYRLQNTNIFFRNVAFANNCSCLYGTLVCIKGKPRGMPRVALPVTLAARVDWT